MAVIIILCWLLVDYGKFESGGRFSPAVCFFLRFPEIEDTAPKYLGLGAGSHNNPPRQIINSCNKSRSRSTIAGAATTSVGMNQ